MTTKPRDTRAIGALPPGIPESRPYRRRWVFCLPILQYFGLPGNLPLPSSELLANPQGAHPELEKRWLQANVLFALPSLFPSRFYIYFGLIWENPIE